MNGTQAMPTMPAPDPWRDRVNGIVSGVRRESRIYFALGATLYVLSGITCFLVVRDPSMTALVVMGLFQLLVLFFATIKIFPCIRGGFLVSVEQTYETIGDMHAIREAIERERGVSVKPKSRAVVEE